jgi:hypothetical protein
MFGTALVRSLGITTLAAVLAALLAAPLARAQDAPPVRVRGSAPAELQEIRFAPSPPTLKWPPREGWRRGRDSNPRYGCPYAAFRVRCIQPLCHLSGASEINGLQL